MKIYGTMCGPVNTVLAAAIKATILAYPSKQIARIVLLWETLVMRFSASLRSGFEDGQTGQFAIT